MFRARTLDWQEWVHGAARVGRVVSKHGLRGTLRLAAWRVSRLAYVREEYVWYRLDIQRDRVRIRLPRHVSVIRGRRADVDALGALPTIGPRKARRRLDEGAELWIANHLGRVVSACWIYRRRTPALAATSGWVDLPPGTVGLEDSVTSDEFAGSILASAVWSAVAGALAEQGVQAIVTKVEETNLPCRRAIERAGFHAVASMQLQRIGGRARVDLRLHEEMSAAAFLAAQFAR